MSALAIRIEGLSKEYTLGGPARGYRTIRESVTEGTRDALRWASNRVRMKPRTKGKTGPQRFHALQDVSLTANQGEVIGLIGRNGAGKSTLLKVLSRITEPTEGFAEIHGRVGSLLEVGTGFHGELTGRENIFLNGAILGMSRADIRRQFDSIVEFAEVEKFIDTPVKHYSSGMYLRLAFAVAAHLEPEVLLVDEVLAVGDLSFQKKCLGKMGEVAKQGRTILFVSHNMGAVRSLCEKGVVLEKGRIVETGTIGHAIETYYKLTAAAEKADVEMDRTGFGPVTLKSHPSMTIEQSEGFELATTLNIKNEVAGFNMICILEDMHQRQIMHLRQDSPNFRAGHWAGAHKVRLKVPPLWLEPGLYSLHFKALLWGGTAGQQKYLSDVVHLDVGGESSGWGALLSPRCDWAMDPHELETTT